MNSIATMDRPWLIQARRLIGALLKVLCSRVQISISIALASSLDNVNVLASLLYLEDTFSFPYQKGSFLCSAVLIGLATKKTMNAPSVESPPPLCEGGKGPSEAICTASAAQRS